MTRMYICMALGFLLATGCASTPEPTGKLVDSSSNPSSDTRSAPAVSQVDYEEPLAAELLQPPTVVEPTESKPGVVALPPVPQDGTLTLEALEQIALANSPAISQQNARVSALRGKWLQVGLAPNPSVGYVAGEIGNEGTAGQQGGFVGQKFITGKKLERNRAVVAAEISQAEQELAAVQRRVTTDVRHGYYGGLLAQRRVQLADELVRVTSKAVEASKALYEAEEVPLAGLLQTEVQQQEAELLSRTAQNGLQQAWRKLSTSIGGSELPIQPLVGDIDEIPESIEWEHQLSRLITESPEIAIAMAKVDRARHVLNRACVDAVPDISTQLSVQYDDSTNDTIAGVQIGLPIPLWNRNQGGICQAQAEVSEAVRNVDRVELNLQRRLADAFQQYANAYLTTNSYASDILPRALRTYDLVQQGYKQGEVGYLDVLAAQRTYSQTNLAYLDALSSLWSSYLQIDGLLLAGSLDGQSQ